MLCASGAPDHGIRADRDLRARSAGADRDRVARVRKQVVRDELVVAIAAAADQIEADHAALAARRALRSARAFVRAARAAAQTARCTRGVVGQLGERSAARERAMRGARNAIVAVRSRSPSSTAAPARRARPRCARPESARRRSCRPTRIVSAELGQRDAEAARAATSAISLQHEP